MRAAILDVDGTLVDTNYHHALAWYRAFRRHGVAPPVWRVHRHIGMGGDQLVEAVAGAEVERGERRRDPLCSNRWPSSVRVSSAPRSTVDPGR